jgi:hypothetical protein
MKQVIIKFKTGRILDWAGTLDTNHVEMKSNMVTAKKDGKEYTYLLKDIESVIVDTDNLGEKPVTLYPRQ